MSDIIEEEVNTDPKWKSFLQAFDKNPTPDQLDGREEEVSQTLASATRVADSLLPELRKKHGKVIEGLRGELVALKDKPPAERFNQMDTLLRRANTEKKECDDDAKKKGNKPSDAKLNSEIAVVDLIGKVEKIEHPGLRESMKDELIKIKGQLEEAGKKKSNRDFYEAIQGIDISGLQSSYKKAFDIDNKIVVGLNNVTKSKESLEAVKGERRDGEPYKKVSVRLGEVEEELVSIRQSDGKAEGLLKTCLDWYLKTYDLNEDASKLVTEEDKGDLEKRKTAAELQGKIDPILATIDTVLKQANTVLTTCQTPMVDALLKALQVQVEALVKAKSEAIGKDTQDDVLKALEAVSTEKVAVAMAKVQDALKGVPRLMGSLDELIAGVPEKEREALAKRLGLLKEKFEASMAEGGADLKDMKAKLIQMVKDVAAASKQDETELLLKAQFGVSVETLGKFKPNLKGTYEAMCMVPDSHVGQDKLQKIVFDYTVIKPYGEYGDSVVTMQSKLFDYTRVTATAYKMIYKEKPFVVDGVEYKPNHFKITMLHEIGHSVDDKHGIMNARQSGGGFGQWSEETSAKIVTACTDALVKTIGGEKKDKIKECIQAAMDGKPPKKAPDELKADWKTVSAMCDAIENSRDPKEPWYKPGKAINIDNRVYHESYSGTWVSYAEGDRSGGPTVSSYQWRAPGEWFACLYSVAWMKGKPLSGVAGLDDWMPEA